MRHSVDSTESHAAFEDRGGHQIRVHSPEATNTKPPVSTTHTSLADNMKRNNRRNMQPRIWIRENRRSGHFRCWESGTDCRGERLTIAGISVAADAAPRNCPPTSDSGPVTSEMMDHGSSTIVVSTIVWKPYHVRDGFMDDA